MCIHIGPRILGLALFQQHIRDNFVQLSYQLEEWIFGKVFEGKFSLACIAGISLPQHCMAVARNHLQNRIRCGQDCVLLCQREEKKHFSISAEHQYHTTTAVGSVKCFKSTLITLNKTAIKLEKSEAGRVNSFLNLRTALQKTMEQH